MGESSPVKVRGTVGLAESVAYVNDRRRLALGTNRELLIVHERISLIVYWVPREQQERSLSDPYSLVLDFCQV